ncbi:Arrestin domain containing [Nesidiocoris tenuis]|uniref:Arrestin domain containing n=1 Tax=Nesidiocoris tenuis TaxID=355587 RepID=A0ABN7AQG8_9HEMI|nr:Arrestin domain containing [Nesidiocoris tenuis]
MIRRNPPPESFESIWMTMERLELILEEPDKVFFSGDAIRGQVLVYLSASIAVQAVVVKFIGEACVSVPEGVGADKPTKKRKNVTNKIAPIKNEAGMNETNPAPAPGWAKDKTPPASNASAAPTPSTPVKLRSKSSTRSSLGPKPVFSSHEKYFFHKEYLYGHKYSSFREKLWPGNHSFPFQFTLPAQLPASFQGRFGYVRYYCEALLLRWKEKDVRRVYFSVTNTADINTNTLAESGCEEQKTTNSCFFCCPRGTIVASAELKRRGFAPGEIAPLLVEIHNMSNSTITTLKAVIFQVVEYSSSQGLRHHEDERRVLEVNRGEVKPGSSMSWGSAGVRLPPLPPTSFTPDSCKIISIQYRIDIQIYITGVQEPLTLKLPIIIGNIPLKRHFPALATAEDLGELLAASFPKHTYARYPHLPGTTSQESVNPEQADCVYKLPHFKPRYLVYVPKTLVT